MSIPPPGPLAYEGDVTVPYINKKFAPTTSNNQFPVPTLWTDTSASQPYILVSKPQGVANWFQIADGSIVIGTVKELIPNSGTSPVVSNGTGQITDVGTGSITTVGSLNTITTQLTGLTNHSLLVGAGTPTITNLGVATDGQLPIGSTGADPVLSTLTAGAGISITNGAGSITIATSGGGIGVDSFIPDSGTSPVVPNGFGEITIAGSGSITTVGGSNSLTTQLTGLTNHSVLVGAGTSTITKVGPSATTGAPLISGGVAADPVYATTFVVNDAGSFASEITTLVGGAVQLGVENLDDTNTSSSARVTITAKGPTAGDTYVIYDLNQSGNNYAMGARQSDSHFVLQRATDTSMANMQGTTIFDYNPTADASPEPLTPSAIFTNTNALALETSSPGQELSISCTQVDFSNAASSAVVESRVAGSPGSIAGDAWMATVGNLDWSWGEDATNPAVPVFRFGHGGSPRGFSGRFYEISVSGVITFGDSFSPGNFYSFPLADGGNGDVLTTNGSGVLSFQPAGSGGIGTINGNSGSVTGSSVTLTGGSSGAVFTGASTTLTTTFDYLSMSATDNLGNGVVSIGGSVYLSGIQNNTFVGPLSGNTTATNSGTDPNVGVGIGTLFALTTGTNNVGIGNSSGGSLTSGGGNIAIGSALGGLITGNYNVALGMVTGINLTGAESSNILISNAGQTSESNTIRIGTQGSSLGQQDTCYIAGIAGVSVSNTQLATIDSSTGQMGSTLTPAVTSISFGGTALNNYTEGTFTPTYIGGTSAGTTTYTTQQGYYTRIGNMVTCSIRIAITSATGTGIGTIGNLPFTIKNQANYQPVGSISSLNNLPLSSGYTYPYTLGVANTTTLITGQYNPTTGAGVALNIASGAVDFYINISYFI